MDTPQLGAPLGILGGTFDPVHNGHLEVAVEVAERLGIEDMRLMPNPMPPHRQRPLLSPARRIAALEAALTSYPSLSLELDEWNGLQNGSAIAGYTVDSLESLRAKHPNRPLVFVMGDDAFEHIETWKAYESLPRLAHIVVVSRPGYTAPASGVAAEWLMKYTATESRNIHRALSGTVQHLTVSAIDVSATQIRECLAARRMPIGMVPDSVITLLEQY